MKIKEIILLPSIIDKLNWKHHVSEQEVGKLFGINPNFVGLKKDESKMKIYILLYVKLTRVDI